MARRKQRRKQASSDILAGSAPATEFGGSDKPGKVEGGNVDPVIVRGETKIRPVDLIPPNMHIKKMAYKKNSEEAVLICDNNSCFDAMKSIPLTSQFESRVYYMNGSHMIDVLTETYGMYELNGPNFPRDRVSPRFRFHDAAWRPMPVSSVNRDDNFNDADTENTINDICLLVGETRYEITPDSTTFPGGLVAYPAQYNVNAPAWEIGVFFPFFARNQSMFQTPIQDEPTAPLQRIQNFPLTVTETNGSQSTNFPDNVTFFAIDSMDRIHPDSPTITPYSYNLFVVAGAIQTTEGNYQPIAYVLRATFEYILPTNNFLAGYTALGSILPNRQLSFEATRVSISPRSDNEVIYDVTINDYTGEVFMVGQSMEDGDLHPVYSFDIRSQTFTASDARTATDAPVYPRFENESVFMLQLDFGTVFYFPTDDLDGFLNPLAMTAESIDLRPGQKLVADLDPYKALSTGDYTNYARNNCGIFTIDTIRDEYISVTERVGNYKPSLLAWGWLRTDINAGANQIYVYVNERAEGQQFTFFPNSPNFIAISTGSGIQVLRYTTSTLDDPPLALPIGGAAPLNTVGYVLGGVTWGQMGTTAQNVTIRDEAEPFATQIQRIVFTEASCHSRLTSAEWRPNMASAMFCGENGTLKKYLRRGSDIVDIGEQANTTDIIDFNPIAWRSDGRYAIIGAISPLNASIVKYGSRFDRISVPSFSSISSIAFNPKQDKVYLCGLGLYEFTEDMDITFNKSVYYASGEKTLMRNQMLVPIENGAQNTFFPIFSSFIELGDIDFNSATLFVEATYELAALAQEADYSLLIWVYLAPNAPKNLQEMQFWQPAAQPWHYIPNAVIQRHGFFLGTIHHVDTTGGVTQYYPSIWVERDVDNGAVYYYISRKAYKLPIGNLGAQSDDPATSSGFARYMFIGVMNLLLDNDATMGDEPVYVSVSLQGQRPAK